MKTIGIIVLALITISCASHSEEKKFVNPIFYKVMEPLSRASWRTQITTNEMVRSKNGDVVIQKCILVENTMEAVTLQCEGPYDWKSNITLYRFVLVPDNKDYGGMLVHMYYRGVDAKEFRSSLSLVINAED